MVVAGRTVTGRRILAALVYVLQFAKRICNGCHLTKKAERETSLNDVVLRIIVYDESTVATDRLEERGFHSSD
jgi:hypothetical protein